MHSPMRWPVPAAKSAASATAKSTASATAAASTASRSWHQQYLLVNRWVYYITL